MLLSIFCSIAPDEVIELLLWRDARFESVMRNKTDSAD
jgi:hypothetical protein